MYIIIIYFFIYLFGGGGGPDYVKMLGQGREMSEQPFPVTNTELQNGPKLLHCNKCSVFSYSQHGQVGWGNVIIVCCISP